ncbi:MAG TPA: NB-ARC domain-containing protein [Alphaproteobacteria bacterium]|nr:NB-ARC domain-containing protein [Alphaproteobacteria bacterium]
MMRLLLRLFIFFLVGCSKVFATPLLLEIPPQNPHFVGRQALLQVLHQALQTQPWVVITGGPGFGKTQIAKQYAYLHQNSYDIIWWFKVDHTLPHQFENFTAALNKALPENERIRHKGVTTDKLMMDIKQALHRQRKKCLFIFDEIDNLEKFSPFIFGFSDFHTLVTTRKKIPPYKSFTVEKLQRKEAISLLKQLLTYESDINLEKLASYFKDHPLALVTSASFLLAYPSITSSAYLSSHDLQRDEDNPNKCGDDNKQNITITLKMALKALSQENPEASQILKLLTLLHHTQIPFAYLDPFLKNIKASQSDHKILSVLYGQSLVEVKKSDNPNNVRLSMHELIHQLMGDQISASEKQDLFQHIIPVIAEFFSGRSDIICQKIVASPEHLLHAQSIFDEARKAGFISLSLLSLKIHALDVILCSLRDFESAKVLLEDISQDQSQLIPATGELSLEDQALLETDRTFFSSAYFADYEQAIKYGEKALDLLSQISDANEEKIRMIANMAQNHILRGELEKGELLIQKGIPFLERSKSDVYNALFVFAWSLLLVSQGNLEETIQLVDRYEPLFRKVTDYPTMAIYALFEKAEALAKKGRYTECKKVIIKTEKMISDFFGNRETSTHANLYVFKALNMLNDPCQVPHAFPLVNKAIEIYRNTFHGEAKHFMQAFSYFVMGQLYEHQGKPTEAVQAYLQSEAIYDVILKEKAMDDISRLYAAIALHGIKTQDLSMAKLYTQQHIGIFGADHPRTLEIVAKADQKGMLVLE